VRLRPLHTVSLICAVALAACAPGGVGGDGDGDGAGGDLLRLDGTGPADSRGPDGLGPADAVEGPSTPGSPAYLHADLWSVWWNDRTRCGAERTFLEICTARGEKDCNLYQQAWSACDPSQVVYGQVGPEKQSEPLCQQSKYPAVGGCDATKYDFGKLRFWWYGAEWQGNWPVATLKVFPQGGDWKGGGELIALSNVPGAAQAAMSGINNHGLGYGCAMLGVTSGADKYLKPFGGFAWVEVPTDTPVTVAALAASNFANQAFAGCSRGAATQTPWVTAPPGAVLGCVYVEEDVIFKPGHHYYWRGGKLAELAGAGPPQELVAGFALVGVSIQSKSSCKL
jgi:hypothetical protein